MLVNPDDSAVDHQVGKEDSSSLADPFSNSALISTYVNLGSY
jgi:hypothetical protein